MFTVKRLALPISLFTLLISLALIVPAAFTSQGSAESSFVQYTTTPPDPSLPLPVKEFEVDRHYSYHIPSDEEVVANKQKLMKEDKFKEKAKQVGQQQAEKDLDATLKEQVQYLKEKNKLGSEKFPMLKIGEHSAYISKYTYETDYFNNCTGITADPVNMFFYDRGYTQNVISGLYSAGWEESPFVDWEIDQCAYTSSTQPGPNGIGDLRTNDFHMIKGLNERDHMRMWEGGWGRGSESWWSIGGAHHEQVGYSQGSPTHCLIPFDPYGSSFDLAEYHVWNDALGYYPRFFWNAQNAGTFPTCGNSVWNDGTGVGVHMTSDKLNPGDALAPGMARYSADGRFAFTYQTDGNLVLYQIGGGGWTPIWHINRFNYPPGYAVMQSDGNLVVYTSGWYPMWYSNTAGNSVQGLFVQNDGNVVIYRTNWVPIWATNTCCR